MSKRHQLQAREKTFILLSCYSLENTGLKWQLPSINLEGRLLVLTVLSMPRYSSCQHIIIQGAFGLLGLSNRIIRGIQLMIIDYSSCFTTEHLHVREKLGEAVGSGQEKS